MENVIQHNGYIFSASYKATMSFHQEEVRRLKNY